MTNKDDILATIPSEAALSTKLGQLFDQINARTQGAIASLGATTNLPASSMTAALPAAPTAAEVDTAIDVLKTAVEARLDAIEAKVDDILVKIRAALVIQT
jgi:hypothetical protein